MYEHERFTHNGLTVKIMADDSGDSGNPREWDNLGVLWCEHSRYTLGDAGADECETARGIFEECRRRGYGQDRAVRALKRAVGATVVLPLYLLDHSGLSISTGPSAFDPGRWDTSMVGYVFDTAYSREMTGAPVESIERQLENEVKEYDAFLTGNVVGFEVVRKQTCNLGHVHEEVLDSCWGFLVVDGNMGYVRDEARAAADGYERPEAVAPTASPRIVVVIEGGLVQNVIADQAGVEIATLDYDTDGCEEQELADAVMVPQSANSLTGAEYDPSPGFLTHWDAEHNPGDVEKILTAPEHGPADDGRQAEAELCVCPTCDDCPREGV